MAMGQNTTPLNEAQAALLEANVGLLYYFAKKVFAQNPRRMFAMGLDVDELVGFGMKGLIRAARGFDSELGYTFSTFARRPIVQAMYREVLLRAGLPLNMAYEPRGGKPRRVRPTTRWMTEMESTGKSSEAGLWAGSAESPLEVRELLEDLRRRMPARLWRVLELRFGQEMTLQEVGDTMGFTKERARQLEAEAMGKARERLAQLRLTAA
jgi:RNA polymerase sigma factor (sigma-70 family)